MKLAFDIGCHQGRETRTLLAEGYKVVAVDPNPSLLREAIPNMVRVIAACSDKVGIVPFYFCTSWDCISSAQESWTTKGRFVGFGHRWGKPSEVPATTIDALVAIYGIPHHIKIDVEGYELTVLRGMTKKYADLLGFEWTVECGDQAVACVDYLLKLGYSQFGRTDADLSMPSSYMNGYEFLQRHQFSGESADGWGMVWAR